MVYCVAFGCKNNSVVKQKTTRKPSFFRFPSDPKRREKWIKAVRRADWTANKHSRLCSDHFSEDQLCFLYPSSLRLRENAVPNVFPAFPAHLQSSGKQGLTEEQYSVDEALKALRAGIPYSSPSSAGEASEDEAIKTTHDANSGGDGGARARPSLRITRSHDLTSVEEESHAGSPNLMYSSFEKVSLPCEKCKDLKKEVARLQKLLLRKNCQLKEKNQLIRKLEQKNKTSEKRGTK